MSDETFRVFAPAKVNLSLHITGQRPDRYHLLDSLVVFANVGDWLTVSTQGDGGLSVSGRFAAGVPTDDSNHILRIARHFWDGAPLTFHLEKNLPVASGIGGGSADAGACYRAIKALVSGDAAALECLPVKDIGPLAALGADLPMCALSQACRVQGIGEEITPLPDFPALSAVLVNPGVAVSTPEIFKLLKQKDNAKMKRVALGSSDVIQWVAHQRNDLQPSAERLVPEITQVLTALNETSGCQVARMSGSGATCFGLFLDETAAQAAATDLREQHPNWWVVATALNGPVSPNPQLIRSTT